MRTPRVILVSALFMVGLGAPLAADEPAAPAAPPKPTYTVTLELRVGEDGIPEAVQVVGSNDTTPDHVLEREAMKKAIDLKLAPKIKEGKPVQYTARAPFAFIVEGDEGPEPKDVVKPHVVWATQPEYPDDLASTGQIGGVILEAQIGTDGVVHDLSVLRSTNAEFADAAMKAVKQWTFTPAPSGTPFGTARWRLSVCFQTDERTMDWAWRVAPRPSLGNFTVVHRMHPVAGADK